jgi:hypothetical protein
MTMLKRSLTATAVAALLLALPRTPEAKKKQKKIEIKKG